MGLFRDIFLIGLLCLAFPARAASPSFSGPLGLNIVPSARMEETGMVRGGLSTLDPVENATIAVQAADWLNLSLRQTAEISGLGSDPKALSPGIDMKLRLLQEGKLWPEISAGVTGVVGQQALSGDYLVFSKRYKALDFTAGAIRIRADGDINGFGGVEYFTPLKGLSLKLDYGGAVDKTTYMTPDYKPPSPWAAGFNYAPLSWVNIGAAVVGGKKIMATLSLQNNIGRWFGRGDTSSTAQLVNRYRTDNVSTAAMTTDAARYDNTMLHDIRRSLSSIWARLDASPDRPMPQQIGRAARAMSNHAGQTTEELIITPENAGLNGPPIRLMRRDLELAVTARGSPQEIWRHADLNVPIPANLQASTVDITRIDAKHHVPLQFKLILETQISLAEADSGLLYRTNAIGEVRERLGDHILMGFGLRVNGPHNLDRLENIRYAALFPVRSDVARFANKTVSIDRLYHAYLRSFANGQFHVMAAGGYLEEMYAGVGGEVLYRPAGKTWAIGLEGWEAFRRDPDSPLAGMLNGDHVLTGYAKFLYEIPRTDLTLGLKAGRYLGQDLGATLNLSKAMANGVKFDAFITATNFADVDALARPTSLYSGIRLRLPLGNIPYVAAGSEARLVAAPLGRDYGQSLDNPLPLYEMTEPFAARTMIRDWNSISE